MRCAIQLIEKHFGVLQSCARSKPNDLRSKIKDQYAQALEESAMPKRASERSWGKLNNMWGKRAASPVDWDKRQAFFLKLKTGIRQN